MIDSSQFPNYQVLKEPALSFHAEREEDIHVHPLIGLSELGPYSQSIASYMSSPLRVAIVAPFGKASAIKSLLNEMNSEHMPRERMAYMIKFRGFSNTFRLGLAAAKNSAIIELPKTFEAELSRSSLPSVLLADTLNKAISTLQTHRTDFDVLMVYLPPSWSAGFYGENEDDFDLHDFLKGLTATRSMPLQIITDDALNYRCRASVMWRLSIAVYCKAGGIPWKLAHTRPDTAYIGLSYAVRKSDHGPRFVTCCSQVFDQNGAGPEFIAYDSNEIHQDYKNPFLSRTEMRNVMARSLRLYQQRHSGKIPKHIAIHKAFDFTPEEIEGCFDAWKASEGLHLIQIQSGSLWRGIAYESPKGGARARPSGYPIERGTVVPIDGRSTLLWTQGNAPSAVGGKNFFKEGKSIPKPLLLTRHAGHGPWTEDCEAILGLTKMNWNNDVLYDTRPVTIGFAEVLAKTIKRIADLGSKPYEFRFFM